MSSFSFIDNLKQYINIYNKEFLFVTLSGAHIYGFPSPDSDYDLRGCHISSLEEVFSLKKAKDTFEVSTVYEGKEMDVVSHEVKKYFSLISGGNNGYVMEQIYSPAVVSESLYFPLLKEIASEFISGLMYHHYRGFAGNQLKIISKKEFPAAKSFLYLYRVLMTGIEVLNSGRIESHILELNKKFEFDFIPELIEAKLKEKSKIPSGKVDFFLKKVEFLEKELDKAYENSSLPEKPGEKSFNKLEKFLYDIRIDSFRKVV